MAGASIGKVVLILPLLAFLCLQSAGAAENFLIDAKLQPGAAGETQLVVQAVLPAGYKLYADQFKLEAPAQVKIIPLALPVPREEKDAYSGEKKLFYKQSFTAVYLVAGLTNGALAIKITYQGCDQTQCFLPAARDFYLELAGRTTARQAPPAAGQAAESGPREAASGDWLNNLRQNYKMVAARSGYMDARSFVAFLDSGRHGAQPADAVQHAWQIGKKWLSILLVILGGLALNLTPCVLPLIPVNLAIIGAGARSASARQGFLRGALYGLGIVLVYGALGVVTVKTGAQFGAINASPWFNLSVAVIFLALALALFDLIRIDFSRFQSRWPMPGQGLWFVLALGAVSAILAGACVAPVVIAVLLLATDLYLKGESIGLIMPFFLGLGMALPWPLAGAGLAWLPKPGQWMTRVKQVFAAIILLAAFYYGAQAVKLFSRNSAEQPPASHFPSGERWLKLSDHAPRDPGEKPVLIYFGASWCKSCNAMEANTFRNAAVRQKLDEFIGLKYAAENPQAETVRAVLREFAILGLPTYVIMERKNTSDQRSEIRAQPDR